jgi:DNA polymerase sigma
MVISSVQQHPARRGDRANYQNYSLGHYFMHFLRTYGHNFNYSLLGISVRGEGFLYKRRDRGWHSDGMLSVECPQDTSFDLGKNSFQFRRVVKAFEGAYKTL